MKTKFFLCMRPPVIETDYEDRSVSMTGKTGRRNRDLQHKKTVAQEKHIGQMSIKSNSDIPENKVKSYYVEESVCLKKLSTRISSNKVSGGPKSNIGGCIMMVSSLLFTLFFGKLFGIVCTLVLVCCLYPRRKNDVIGVRMSENVVVKWPEEGSPEEYKKRVIMAGLLERKSHYR